MLTRRRTLALAAAAALSPGIGVAGPAARLIDGPWQRFGSGVGPSHAAWSAILADHLVTGADGVARFDYAALDRGRLAAYVAMLEAADPTAMGRDAAFAYWVNVYNAVTIAVVAEAYPIRSIRDIGGGLFSPGPWREPVFTVLGRTLSLDEVEHGILRPVWGDARIHYAVNCASIGCPNLKASAWDASTLETDLDAAARAYVNHPRGARIEGGDLTVSSIYDWFVEDFGGNDAGVIAHLSRYAAPALATDLSGASRIARHDYDWALNDI
ncbi:MAG: DUF547 domain-containing protein [Rubricella sp.]